ncbi:MAG: CoA transferase [Pseudomonadales bacterium]|nr:CoA transferase [Pseudomonadales bacterium]MCP5185479.1 CoA transferase [Pseudomonadales bacterium]
MAAPLDGVRVIEIDSWMAAPSAGALLADLGADVIKIEPPGGDPMRGNQRPAKVDSGFKDYDLQFDVDNRGKRSIVVALDTDEGVAVAHRLVASAQVFMCNLLIQRQQKYRLDPASLFGINPHLVHATLTGYGTTGPDAWRPGYDVTAFFGRSGLYDAMREGEGGTVPMARPAQGDHTTGLAMLGSILAALRLMERTGEGQVVETSLYETAVWTQASDYGVTAVDNAPVRRRARHEMLTITGNRFPCGDGKWVVFNMMDKGAFERLCRTIGTEEWLTDERFRDASSRYRNMRALVEGVDAALAAKSRDEWGVIFDKAGLIWGPVLTLDEVSRDPHAHAIGLFPEIEHPELGRYRTVNAPFRFATADVRPRGSAPTVGANTRAILAEAGYTEAEIQRLQGSGAIGAA